MQESRSWKGKCSCIIFAKLLIICFTHKLSSNPHEPGGSTGRGRRETMVTTARVGERRRRPGGRARRSGRILGNTAINRDRISRGGEHNNQLGQGRRETMVTTTRIGVRRRRRCMTQRGGRRRRRGGRTRRCGQTTAELAKTNDLIERGTAGPTVWLQQECLRHQAHK